MWAVLYDDGTSLTTVSEPIAHSLAEAERQRGRHVTVRRLDEGADGVLEPEPGSESEPVRPTGRLASREPISQPEPTLEPEPTRAAEPAPAPEPARTPEPAQFPGPTQAVEPSQAGGPAPVPGPASEA